MIMLHCRLSVAIVGVFALVYFTDSFQQAKFDVTLL